MIQSALREYWRLNPVDATRAGVPDFDGQLPDLSPDGLEARRDWRRQARSTNELDELDRRVLLAEICGEDVFDEFQWTSRAPHMYVEEAMRGLHYLVARRADPELALRSRIAAVPRLLEHARGNLDGSLVPPEWVEIALTSCDGADSFLASIADSEAARQAITDYATFLRHELRPRGSFVLGPERFERLLHEQHGLDLAPDDVYARGEELAHSLLDQLRASGGAWRDEIEALKADHPTADTLLQTYANEAARARAFVEANQLVSIPPGEQFEVRPTAPFLRATTPLGHFDRTPPFAPEDNLGILYITPIDASLTQRRQQELLEAHCHTAIRAICLHETFPGHHVQLWHAKLRASPIRKQFHSSLFSEGWALYCEELMEEAGYYDTPGLHLWRLKNAMWRAVRLMVDVGLHCRGLSVEAAAQPLIELGGLEPNTARGEALRYTTSPTQPSSYVLGRDRIVDMRRRAEHGPEFSLRAFHDRLLGFGSAPPAFIPDE